MMALLGIAVFVAAMVLDFAETRYVLAVERKAGRDAAAWSVLMWAISCFGFVAVLNVSLWLLVPEGLGLYCGTRLALRARPCSA